MQATARLFGQTMGAALVALVFAAFPLNGTPWRCSSPPRAGVAACVSFSRLAAR